MVGTRAKDPFAEVWGGGPVSLLQADDRGVLEATELLRVLSERHPGEFDGRHLRTLQRRVSDWRALHGPDQEVYFEQVHVPGREGAFDFTNATELGVTIGGVLPVHLLFDFVLSFSKWRWACVAFSETFEAMVHGLQGAIWELGGVPAVWRSDNLSAATHQLPEGGRELTRRYKAVIDHYGVTSDPHRAAQVQPEWGRREGQRPAQAARRSGPHHSRQPGFRERGRVRGFRARRRGRDESRLGPASGRRAATPAAAPVNPSAGVYDLLGDSAVLEHDPLRQAYLLRAISAQGQGARGEAIRRCDRALVRQEADRNHATDSWRENVPHRLPTCDSGRWCASRGRLRGTATGKSSSPR